MVYNQFTQIKCFFFFCTKFCYNIWVQFILILSLNNNLNNYLIEKESAKYTRNFRFGVNWFYNNVYI